MYKVLLIDDEYYIRQRLKTCIDWETEEFIIAGEAQNAEEAASFMVQTPVDLVVADISMPQKDGLTLIKELREKNVNVKVIILSGYGTFAYAQKAIEYGVTQYLLKPIDEEELIKSLKQVRQTLNAEQAIQQIHQTRHKADYLLTTIRKENYFRKIFTTHPLFISDLNVLDSQMADYSLHRDIPCRILVFDFDHRHLQNLSVEDLQLFRYAANNILCELAPPYCTPVGAPDLFGHGVLICEMHSQDDPMLNGYLEQSADKVKEFLSLNICIGCSPCFLLSLQELNRQYQHALFSYVLSSLRHCTHVVYDFAEIPVTESYEMTRTLEKIDACFSPQHQKELCSAIDTYFSLLEQQTFSFFFLDQELSRLVMICHRRADQNHAFLSHAEDISFLTGYKELLFAGYDLSYIRHKMQYLIESMLNASGAHTAGTARESLAEDAMRFIDAHYYRCDMSLTLLSQNLLISPAYLSSIFKKIKGISINQYLTKTRMEKARELLINHSLTLTEIAERVGYNDLFYFSKVFKRHFGMAPSAYKFSG